MNTCTAISVEHTMSAREGDVILRWFDVTVERARKLYTVKVVTGTDDHTVTPFHAIRDGASRQPAREVRYQLDQAARAAVLPEVFHAKRSEARLYRPAPERRCTGCGANIDQSQPHDRGCAEEPAALGPSPEAEHVHRGLRCAS